MNDKPRTIMPVWQWPSRDRTAWAKACQPPDPFDPTIGRAGIWRASTLTNYEEGYGRWLAFLEQIGQLDREVAPGERATPDRLRAFLAHLQENVAPYTQAGYLMGLARVLAAMDPGEDYGWIARGSRRIHGQARPVNDVTERLQDADKVLQLGLDLMWEAEHGRFRTDHQNATLFRDGLMLALLVLRPLRIANFSAIRIGQQLQRKGEGWRLSFTAEEMKNGRPFECSFPGDLTLALERYLEVHRKTLLDGKGKASEGAGALWISRGSNGAMSKGDIRVRLTKITADEFGTSVNPHSMRHLLASTVATDNPEGVTDVPNMLGHDDPETCQVYYNKARQADAVLRYQETVKARRGRGRYPAK